MGGEGPRSRSSKEPAKTKSSEPSSEGEYWWTGFVGMEMEAVVVALVALGDLLVDVRLVTLCEVLEVLEGLVTEVLSVSPSSDEPARRSRSSRRRLSFLPVRENVSGAATMTGSRVRQEARQVELPRGGPVAVGTYGSCAEQCGSGFCGARPSRRSWSSPRQAERRS